MNYGNAILVHNLNTLFMFFIINNFFRSDGVEILLILTNFSHFFQIYNFITNTFEMFILEVRM